MFLHFSYFFVQSTKKYEKCKNISNKKKGTPKAYPLVQKKIRAIIRELSTDPNCCVVYRITFAGDIFTPVGVVKSKS